MFVENMGSKALVLQLSDKIYFGKVKQYVYKRRTSKEN